MALYTLFLFEKTMDLRDSNNIYLKFSTASGFTDLQQENCRPDNCSLVKPVHIQCIQLSQSEHCTQSTLDLPGRRLLPH